jgi:Ca2+-binding RTX toxin-like protein
MPPSRIRPRRWALAATLALLMTVGSGAAAMANTSHEGWPRINGVLLMNKRDQSRPLDARPGHDLFGGTDRSYSCDGLHKNRSCAHSSGVVARRGHNELLGGHGNDTIHAGPQGDVIWGDYKPSGQPSSQVDRLFGGNSRDFIYASHGTNIIRARGGDDYVKAHFGHGIIDCGGGRDMLYVSRRAQKGYKIRHCEKISHKTLGY